jgi:hypothetical protein
MGSVSRPAFSSAWAPVLATLALLLHPDVCFADSYLSNALAFVTHVTGLAAMLGEDGCAVANRDRAQLPPPPLPSSDQGCPVVPFKGSMKDETGKHPETFTWNPADRTFLINGELLSNWLKNPPDKTVSADGKTTTYVLHTDGMPRALPKDPCWLNPTLSARCDNGAPAGALIVTLTGIPLGCDNSFPSQSIELRPTQPLGWYEIAAVNPLGTLDTFVPLPPAQEHGDLIKDGYK